MDTRKLGQLGEELAAQFLIDKGYRILGRNLKTQLGEIDILAQHGTTTVVVEVKAKSSQAYGYPAEMVTPTKLRKLRRLAESQASLHNMVDYRIDVVAIILNDSHPKIEHLINVN